MEIAVDASPGEKPKGFKSLLDILERLLLTEEYSDLTITCHGSEWKVHKAIVCIASDFFKACCKNFKEASSGVIDLPDDRADAVNALLVYIYTADYDDSKEDLNFRPLLFNILVHTIGDKYGMRNLCQLAEAKFEKRATEEWQSDAFADSIMEISLTSPDSKRVLFNIAAEIAAKHAKQLFTGKETKFQETVRKVAPFAFEVTSRLMAPQPSEDMRYTRCECPLCAKTFVVDKKSTPTGRLMYCCYCGRQGQPDEFKLWNAYA